LAGACLQALFLSADGLFQVAGPVYEGDLQVQRCFCCPLGGLNLVFVSHGAVYHFRGVWEGQQLAGSSRLCAKSKPARWELIDLLVSFCHRIDELVCLPPLSALFPLAVPDETGVPEL